MKELFFTDNEIIVSKTDTKGKITYGNELFIKLSGYSEDELLGQPHNIIRHPKMPRAIFHLLWSVLQEGKEVNAYVINQSKNGDFYWVYANVTPSFDTNGKTIGYYSVRRKPTQSAIKVIEPMYKELYEAEKSGGMKKSQEILNEMLNLVGGRYDKFIVSL